MDSQAEYKLRVTKLLGMYQMVEFSLKIYISGVYSLIRKKLDGQFPFEYRYRDIKNAPLGRLNKNTYLQKRLGKLIEHRNYIAHRALIERHDVIRDLLGICSDEEEIDVAAAENEVNECLVLLSKELEVIFDMENPSKA